MATEVAAEAVVVSKQLLVDLVEPVLTHRTAEPAVCGSLEQAFYELGAGSCTHLFPLRGSVGFSQFG
jgi:hypothetical protein